MRKTQVGIGPIRVDQHSVMQEHRAPTDESVKLLREMENAARKRVVEAMKLPFNGLRGTLQREKDLFTGETLLRAVFDLNGTPVTVEHRVPTEDYEGGPNLKVGAIWALRDAVAKVIAGILVIDQSKRLA